MTPRENLLSLYRRQGYRHVPVHVSLCPSLQEKYKSLAGDTPMAEYFDYPEGFADSYVPGLLVKGYGGEFDGPGVPDWSKYYDTQFRDGTSFDLYGVAHEPGSEAARHMTRMHHPMGRMTSLEQMQAYPLPVFDTENISHITSAVNDLHANGKAAVASMSCTVWEIAWYIRDMAMLMMDMTEDNPRATYILDQVTEMACRRATVFAAAGVDIIGLGDDIGMQQSIMMSRSMYRQWLWPRLVRVIASAKAANPDVLIFYHSCGYIEPFIDDLIEAGIEILNPVQPECMAFADIHSRFGDRLSFNGTLGTQTTMPFGTPADVRKVVLENLETAGSSGGLLCCPTHLLEPEVPWESIVAYVEACKEFTKAGS